MEQEALQCSRLAFRKPPFILVIDGDKGRSQSLALRLRLNGHDVELCSSGFRAVHLLEAEKSQPYALVLIGGDAEDMPGREVLLLARTIVKEKGSAPHSLLHVQRDGGQGSSSNC